MTDTRLEVLCKDRQTQLDLVAQILDTADKLQQDLTAEDAAVVEAATAKVADLDRKIREGKDDLNVIELAKKIGGQVGESLGPGQEPPPAATGHLAFTGVHAKALAGRIITAMPKDATGTKALASGQQTTSVIMAPQVQEIGRPAQSVLDLLPARVTAPSYSFLRQTVRTMLAAPVAEGGTKPTSIVSVIAVQNRLRVVAHISEPIAHYVVDDADQLRRFIEDDMIWGLRKAVETEVLSGDGTGEHFTGILNTSGIVAPSFATDALTSIRKGLTVLDVSGYVPGQICLSAGDWEAIELLLASSGAINMQGVPIDPVARRLWGVPVTLNQGLGAKTGLIIAQDAVTLDHDGLVDTRWSDAVGTDFQTNACPLPRRGPVRPVGESARCRGEGRDRSISLPRGGGPRPPSGPRRGRGSGAAFQRTRSRSRH